MVLVGPNGAGKTNLLEAISLLAPGRGLRRATLDEVAFSEGDGSWAVSAEIEGALGLATLGTGIEPPPARRRDDAAQMPHRPRAGRLGRRLRRSSARGLADAGDGRLFTGPASERRRFLDRLVLAVDAEHGSRVNALERALRSRNRLLEDPRRDAHWLDAVEHETAELAVAVAAARAETVEPPRRRARRARNDARRFRRPRSRSTAGWKSCCRSTPAVEVEDRYRAVLRDNRARDAAAGRTLDGPHLTDLAVDLRAERTCPPPTPRPASRRRC